MLDGERGNWESQKRNWEQKCKTALSYKRKYEDLVRIIDMQDGIAGNVEDQIRAMKQRADRLDGVEGNFKQQKVQWDRKVKKAMEWKKKYEDLVTLIDMQDNIQGNVEDQILEMKKRADSLDGVKGNFESQKRQWEKEIRSKNRENSHMKTQISTLKRDLQKQYDELYKSSKNWMNKVAR